MAFGVPLSELYFNRELSWVEFNSRVLEEALPPTHPCLNDSSFSGFFTLEPRRVLLFAGWPLSANSSRIPCAQLPDQHGHKRHAESIRARVI